MPLKAPRFIHVQTPGGRYNGFSVQLYVTDTAADATSGAPITMVYYHVAVCSKEDQFCRATGRSFAITAPVKTCRLVDLPMELARLHYRCLGYEIGGPVKQQRRFANEYAWVFKYFL